VSGTGNPFACFPLSGGCVEQRFQHKLPLAHSFATLSLTMTTEAVATKMNEVKKELAAVGAAAAAGVILGLLLRRRT